MSDSKQSIEKNIRTYGAVGDGTTNDTASIQSAINGGGVVVIPQGKYLVGTLYLSSNLDLRFEEGAELLASTDPACYNADDFAIQNPPPLIEESVSAKHLLVAIGKKNISISGGTINGRAELWMNRLEPEFGKLLQLHPERPAQMLFFCECENITIDRLKLINSTYWNLFLHGCENVSLSGMVISGKTGLLNNDGIDVDCCRKVKISGCIIDVCDDAIAIRASGKNLTQRRDCEDVTVSNCILSSSIANAIRIGVGDGLIKNCRFSNLVIRKSNIGIGLISKYSKKSDGCSIEDISFENLSMEVGRPFSLRTRLNESIPFPSKSGALIRNISFRGITGTAERSSYITGTSGNPIENVLFSNIFFVYGGVGAAPDVDKDGFWGRMSADVFFAAAYAPNLVLDRIDITGRPPATGWKSEISALECPGMQIRNCTRNGKNEWNTIHSAAN